ncbi:hypothetical protein C8F01DRAFT_1079698 [Mycena amicta]|nr:hypothetical protein C8F01DRAFT_1079698 [Mycena amicta]
MASSVPPAPPPLPPPGPNPLAPTPRTGRQLFASTVETEISERMRGPGALVYQSALKELWDALTDAERAHWQEEAEAEATDVAKTTFSAIWLSHCGIYAKVVGLAMQSSWFSTDSEHPKRMNWSQAPFTLTAFTIQLPLVETGWNAIMVNLGHSGVTLSFLSASASAAHGQPVFPNANINAMSFDDIRNLISDYLNEVWSATNPARTIPWEDMALNPSLYYDTAKYKFWVPLSDSDPKYVSVLDAVRLAQDFLQHSTPSSNEPFMFHATAPPPAPSPSPSPPPPPPPPPPPAARAVIPLPIKTPIPMSTGTPIPPSTGTPIPIKTPIPFRSSPSLIGCYAESCPADRSIENRPEMYTSDGRIGRGRPARPTASGLLTPTFGQKIIYGVYKLSLTPPPSTQPPPSPPTVEGKGKGKRRSEDREEPPKKKKKSRKKDLHESEAGPSTERTSTRKNRLQVQPPPAKKQARQKRVRPSFYYEEVTD